jgi:hypothetical protein
LIITADQIGRNNLNTVSKVLYGKKEKVYVKSQPEAKMSMCDCQFIMMVRFAN